MNMYKCITKNVYRRVLYSICRVTILLIRKFGSIVFIVRKVIIIHSSRNFVNFIVLGLFECECWYVESKRKFAKYESVKCSVYSSEITLDIYWIIK